MFDGKPLDGLPAHERTHLGLARSFQLPRPFLSLTLVDNLRVPLLYTVNARPGAQLTPRRARRPLRRAAARWSGSPTRRDSCRAT